MKKVRQGYTLVEILLFLAVSGLLFIGLIAGMGNSVYQQRFNDTVQNFAEFMRSVYSQVANVQSVGSGRSEHVIYGRLVSFGQTIGLDGERIPDDEQRIFVYDVIGDGEIRQSGPASELLEGAHASVVRVEAATGGTKIAMPAGIAESYAPRWGASIENVDGTLFTGSILVVRHPRSGTINTLYSSRTIDVNQMIKDANLDGTVDGTEKAGFEDMLATIFAATDGTEFTVQDLDFCIDPEGVVNGELIDNEFRRDVRIVSNARNASGIEVIDMDLDYNVAYDTEESGGVVTTHYRQMGNRCRFSSRPDEVTGT